MRRFFPLVPVLVLSLLWAALPGPSACAEDEPPSQPPALQAGDVVVLKNGAVFEGRVVKEDDRVVVVESASGSARLTFPRPDVASVRYGGDAASRRPTQDGPRLVRDEWFLLRRSGRVMGTRHLELWSVRSRGRPGYRLVERIAYSGQGPQLPATRTRRTEETDLRFLPRMLAFHEEGDASRAPGGPGSYTSDVSGRVEDGVWRATAFGAGQAERSEVAVPRGTRGRLGLREHLLHLERRVRLLDERVLEPAAGALVRVRAGFTSVSDVAQDDRVGHEFHWEEDGTRCISFFHPDGRVVREEIAEGIVAVPVSRQQAEAASAQEPSGGEEGRPGEIRLAEAGIAFAAPDRTWAWRPALPSPANTGWRLLGRLENSLLVSDVRVEWHRHGSESERRPEAVEAWLLRRLRGVCPDIEVLSPRRGVGGGAVAGPGLERAWSLDLRGTLKRESVRTHALVVDRPQGRVILLWAAPAGAWDRIRPTLERFVASLRLL